MFARRAPYRPALVLLGRAAIPIPETRIGLVVETCVPTGDRLKDRLRSDWEIWRCSPSNTFVARRGEERSPSFSTAAAARQWVVDHGAISLDEGETKFVLGAVLLLLLLALGVGLVGSVTR